MACTRGCTGVNICNGQICCIQFQQDCGTDCLGLASGFSRIQVNDLGELVICSNVGGICTCEVVGGGGGFLEDTFVDNNDGTITHTSNQGNASTIDICALLAYCEISDLSDVQTALPAVGEALIWNGAAWENQDIAANIDVCAIVAASCNTSLVDNADGTITFTDNAAAANVIDICGIVATSCDITVADNGDGTVTITDISGAPQVLDICDIVSSHCLAAIDVCAQVAAGCNSSLVDQGDGTFTFTDNAGNPTVINICNMVNLGGCSDSMTVVGSVVTHTALNGNVQAFDVCNLVAVGGCSDTVVDNNNGTYTHTSIAGLPTLIDICGDVATYCDITVTDNGDGTFTITEISGAPNVLNVCNMLADGGCTDTLTIVGPVITHTSVANDVQAFNICDIVAINCDITVTDNNDGTFTITDIEGDPFILDVCSMVADGGCTDTLSVLGSVVTHTSLDGTIQAFDICAIVAANCNPSLADIGGGLLQFTDIAGATNNVDICAMVSGNCSDSLTVLGSVVTHTAVDGVVQAFDICAIIAANCNSSLTDNGDGTLTFVDNAGAANVINLDTAVTLTDSVNVVGSVVTHTAVDGDVQAFDICAIVAANCNPSLVHVGAGIIQFTDVGGGTTNIDICAMVAAGGCTDVLVDNGDGTYTHTALDGTVETIDICAAITVADTNCITMIKTPTAGGCEFSAEPILSPDDCQGLECRANGLWMNGDIDGAAISHQQIAETITLAALPVACDYTTNTSNYIQLDNNSVCNDMWGQANIDGTEIFISNTAGTDAGIQWAFEYRTYFNGVAGGWQVSSNNDGNMVARAGGDIYTIPIAGYTTPFRTNPGTFMGLEYRFCIFNPDGNFSGEVRIEFRNMNLWGITTPL